jgi:predicted dehydrogenase
MEINCSGGAVAFEVTPGAVVRWTAAGSDRWTTEVLDEPFSSSFDGAIAEFVQAVEQGREPRVRPRDALALLSLVTGAIR